MGHLDLYNEKLKRLTDVSNGILPDRVPVTGIIETYALAYSGVTMKETQESMLKHLKGYAKLYKDIYFDAVFTPYMSHSLEFGWNLGSDVFFESADGFTLQHKEYCPMEPEDYEDFIKDPVMWILDEFMPRRFPKLNTSNEEQLEAFKKSILPVFKFAGQIMLNTFYFKHVLQTPAMAGGNGEMPCDLPFDYLRGFRPTLTDMHRYPDLYERVVNSLLDYCLDSVKMTHLLMASPTSPPTWLLDNAIHSVIGTREPKMREFPWVFNPCHMPPCLSPDDFYRFYFPTFKKIIETIHNNGGKTLSLLEGKWGPHIERLKELPDHSVVLILENDDVLDVKKKLGNKFCIVGGMPLTLMKNGNTRECIDKAKQIIDECAPDGNFIFSNDKIYMSGSDCQAKNLKAVNEFVHVYGQY